MTKEKSTSSKISEIKIEDLRAKHLGETVKISGKVIQISEARPQAASVKYECEDCGTIISVLQITRIIQQPTQCPCGNKEKFKELSKDFVDVQRVILAQGKLVYDEFYKRKMPHNRMSVFLNGELCDPKMSIPKMLGKNVVVTGILSEKPILNEYGELLTRFDFVIEASEIKRT